MAESEGGTAAPVRRSVFAEWVDSAMMESRFLAIGLLRRIRANPWEYLGAKSLTLLEAFHRGYCEVAFRFSHSAEIVAIKDFRQLVESRYGINLGTGPAVAAYHAVCSSEDLAFDLYLSDIELAGLSDGFEAVDPLRGHIPGASPTTLLGMVETLADHAGIYMRTRSAACLRAFLEGYCLCLRELRLESAIDIDLVSFGHWVNQRSESSGIRWEKLIMAGDIDAARSFESAINLLRSYRELVGIPKPKPFEIILGP